jgi:predicted HicB family RNase H-like nuclease
MSNTEDKRGRPAKQGGYTKSVNLRLTEEQHAKLAEAAKRKRMETGENIIELDILRAFIDALPSPQEQG